MYVIDLMDEYYDKDVTRDSYPHFFEGKERLDEMGVKFVNADLLEYDFADFSAESVDVVMSYHTFEHFHHTPRFLLERVKNQLKKGGMLFIEVPNALFAWNRVKVLIGKTNYVPYKNYWNRYPWYGHIREYSVDDLRALSRNAGFSRFQIIGRNYYSMRFFSAKLYGITIRCVDRLLRLRPGLCASLFLQATKSD